MKVKHLLFMLSVATAPMIMASEVYPSTAVDELPLNDTIVSWQDDGMVIMEDGKGFAAMYNNKDGILFQVLVKDRRLQQQLLREGLVVYVDPNGKKKKKYAVQFPTISRPNPGDPQGRMPQGRHPESMRPGERPEGGPHERHPRHELNEQDTAGMFGDIQPMDPRHRHDDHSKENRERMLKFLVSNLSSEPITFLNDDEESILSQGTAKVMASGNNLVFTAFVSYDRLGKIGKKGEISLGITIKERESSDEEPRGGMFGPHPGGMPGGGMMPPPPGMGGGFRGREMLKESKSFEEWIVFSTKNTNFTTAN